MALEFLSGLRGAFGLASSPEEEELRRRREEQARLAAQSQGLRQPVATPDMLGSGMAADAGVALRDRRKQLEEQERRMLGL